MPIYLGSPNVYDFLPDDNAIINVDHFSSVKELADYIQRASEDEKVLFTCVYVCMYVYTYTYITCIHYMYIYSFPLRDLPELYITR